MGAVSNCCVVGKHAIFWTLDFRNCEIRLPIECVRTCSYTKDENIGSYLPLPACDPKLDWSQL